MKDGDRGAGSVIGIAVLGLALSACLAVALALGIAVERAGAQAAADAGALAGAAHARAAMARGSTDVAATCRVAREAVRRADARPQGCIAGPGARVEVTAARGRATAVSAAAPAFGATGSGAG